MHSVELMSLSFFVVKRRLTGWKDEHISRGFPVLNSGTMMEVVKSFGVVTV